jgi:hypothetical protein
MAMNRLKVIEVKIIQGKKYYVVRGLDGDENSEIQDIDETQLRRVMKAEAVKPLFLLRSE